ncbi:MAG: MBL fold metallo-hydrolase [Bacteroidia bacterium]|nr:MBL fold metallo-hydrolase [Bacteroidia bacterium]
MSAEFGNHPTEVTLIGTGGGYGESTVMHIGNNNWIVVDSCVDPYTKKSLPLEYLRSKGVETETQVKFIVCTHWHDDHILGLSELLNHCSSAQLCMARANDKKKFVRAVGLDSSKISSDSSIASTLEFENCLEILGRRKGIIMEAFQDRLLFEVVSRESTAMLYSLSPSDHVSHQFDAEIATLFEHAQRDRKVVLESPNSKSVVLLLKLNDHNVILGADLEVSPDQNKGWLCILDNSLIARKNKASLFKIPHHGSKNGYDERIWRELLHENPTTKLTPWNLGRGLPQKEMIYKFLEHTDKLFSTSKPRSKIKPKVRDSRIAKIIHEFNSTLAEVKYSYGAVRCTIDVTQPSPTWETELIGEATKISPALF